MRLGSSGRRRWSGAIADATSLRVGLVLVPIAGVTLILLAGALSARARS